MPTPKVSETHPRVFLNASDLPLHRLRAETTHRAEFEALAKAAREPFPSDPKEDGAGQMTRLAFLYLLTEDRTHAEGAIQLAERLTGLPISGDYFAAPRRIRALACVYDWCHALLTPLQRHFLGHYMLANTHYCYANGEIYLGNYLAGHEVNMLPSTLAAAIALGDELPGARAILDDTLDRLGKMFACYKHFLDGGGYSQSYSYTAAYIPEMPVYFLLAEKGLGLDWWAEHDWICQVLPWWTYALRSDETFLRYGDYFCSHPLFGNWGYARCFAAIASRYRDPLAKWWIEKFHDIKNSEVEQFFYDAREPIPTQAPDVLPRTRQFPSMGVAVARGDWKDGTVAAYKCSPVYLHNHCHRDQNQLTVFHKGDLAIDSGVYDGYETPHWLNYYIRTIAHNTVVVHDPQETFVSRHWTLANDGGQRFINKPDWAPRTLDDAKSEAFRDGTIRAYREDAEHSYVCGDASNCYNPSKLKKFLRHVVFVLDWPHPAAVSLVVLDEIELAREGLLPRVLLHSTNEPATDERRVVIAQGGGRLTATFLEPQALKLEKIGGAGKEFWVDGQNYPVTKMPAGPHTPGAWRVEASPAQAQGTAFRFVTLLVPADADKPAEPVPTLEERDGALIVTQGDLSVGLLRKGAHAALKGKRTLSVELAG
ncbi:MAG: heparinase II/III family protein [Planctomycetota bacterium]|nr:heparinase II/III family protein [Planctomycetota bacterium]